MKQNGNALQFVKEQTPEICLEAIKQNSLVLYYVKEQTPEICLEAVKKNGVALQFVKKQNPEICLEAVKQNGWVLGFVKEPTLELYLEAFKKEPLIEKDYPRFQELIQKEAYAHCRAIKQELLAETMKPSRIQQLIDYCGFDTIDCY